MKSKLAKSRPVKNFEPPISVKKMDLESGALWVPLFVHFDMVWALGIKNVAWSDYVEISLRKSVTSSKKMSWSRALAVNVIEIKHIAFHLYRELIHRI